MSKQATSSRPPLLPMVSLVITVAGAAAAGLIGVACVMIEPCTGEDLMAIGIAAAMTWGVFIISLLPLAWHWRGKGLAVFQGYLINASIRTVLGLGGSLWLVKVAGQSAAPTLLTFVGTYLAMMFAEVFVMVRKLQCPSSESELRR